MILNIILVVCQALNMLIMWQYITYRVKETLGLIQVCSRLIRHYHPDMDQVLDQFAQEIKETMTDKDRG